MQDGATSHATDANINFLLEKFRGRVISRRSERLWPSYLPDINPLDFFVWGYFQAAVQRIKPSNVEELRAAVEDVAATVPEEMIRDAAQNVVKRLHGLPQSFRGPFQIFF